MSFPDVLSEGAKTLGIEISEAAQELLARYGAELEEYNKNVNLTAITGQDEIARLHFVDSLSVAAAVSLEGKKAIDIGSGGGFPGLPLKIFEPSLDMTTVDSVGKKVDFMNHIGSMLELEGFVSLHARAEELGQSAEHRQKYDLAVSRAVAQLNLLCELCLPLVKVGGLFVAMKTPESAERELEAAAKAIKLLGGRLEKRFDYTLGDAPRRLLIIKKVAPTPKAYPRRFSRIKAEPL